MRPNKLKCQSPEQRKIDCRAEKEEQEAGFQKPELLWFSGRSFQRQKFRVRAEELRDFVLIGG